MDNGWFIPDEMVGPISQKTFMEMMNVICTGGQVAVTARKDGKIYNWQCDGLKYARRVSIPDAKHGVTDG
jgi:hypothetical protein